MTSPKSTLSASVAGLAASSSSASSSTSASASPSSTPADDTKAASSANGDRDQLSPRPHIPASVGVGDAANGVGESAAATVTNSSPPAADGDGEEEEPDSDAPHQQEEGPTSRKPLDTSFRQNRMRAIYPLMTADRAIVAFMTIATICFSIGIAIYYASNGVIEFSKRYDDVAQLQGCNERNKSGDCLVHVNVSITDNMDPPIYFYYALEDFYQNVRTYADSYSPDQVEGHAADTKQCKDLTQSPVDGRTLYPCGLIANSFFNDSFAASRRSAGGAVQVIGTPTEIGPVSSDGGPRWAKSGIAFPVDVNSKFTGSNYTLYGWSRAGKDLNPLPLPTDEDTMVWMTVAALPQFRKLHRIINVGLAAGDLLEVAINSNYDVRSFNGRKSFVVSTASWMGGKNIFLAWAYFAAAIWSGSCALFLVVKRRWWRREEGDLSYYTKKIPTELNRIITQNQAAGFAAASAGP